MKNIRIFYLKIFLFSIYLNRRVFVMLSKYVFERYRNHGHESLSVTIVIIIIIIIIIIITISVFQEDNIFSTSASPVSILRKSISGRHRPVRVADGPMTARCRFT